MTRPEGGPRTLFRKQSPWDKVRKPLPTVTQARATVRSGLVAAGTAVGVTAMSSAAPRTGRSRSSSEAHHDGVLRCGLRAGRQGRT